MFNQDDPYYVPNNDDYRNVYAYASLFWNEKEMETVMNTGSGHASYGTCSAENSNLLDNINEVTLKFDNFQPGAVQNITGTCWAKR
jgi:hypothetical protein